MGKHRGLALIAIVSVAEEVINASAWAKPLPRAASGGPAKLAPKKKPPIAKPGLAVKAIKVEKKYRVGQEDNEFLKGIMLEAPEIAAVLSKQLTEEDRPMFTVELVYTPDQKWVSEGGRS